jgi:hypothetical protein
MILQATAPITDPAMTPGDAATLDEPEEASTEAVLGMAVVGEDEVAGRKVDALVVAGPNVGGNIRDCA